MPDQSVGQTPGRHVMLAEKSIWFFEKNCIRTVHMYAQQQHITTQYTDPVAVQYRARVETKDQH